MTRISTLSRCLVCLLALVLGCSKDNPVSSEPDSPVTLDPTAAAAVTQASNTQTAALQLYTRLKQTRDSIAARDSVAKYFLADTAVRTVSTGSQGIAVQFKSGIRGGLFFNTKDQPEVTGPPLQKPAAMGKSPGLNHVNVSPNPRRTVFINPHYNDRKTISDQIIAGYPGLFQRSGYLAPEKYLAEQATVDRFCSLSGCGVVHIYSHGWAWPKETAIAEVYLLTGEAVNPATTAKYWTDIQAGNILMPLEQNAVSHYWISPAFLALHNDFRKDTTLVYGGFCYSFLGTWPQTITAAGAGAYFGFSWSVQTWKNANWAYNLIYNLTDTTMNPPMHLERWQSQTPGVPKSYYDNAEAKTVSVQYTGFGTLTLWTPLQITAVSPGAGPEGTSVTISGTGFGTSQGISTLTFNGTAATPLTWSDKLITTKVPAGATTGYIVVTVGGKKSNGYPFSVGSGLLADFNTTRLISVELTATIKTQSTAIDIGSIDGDNSAPLGQTLRNPLVWLGGAFSTNYDYSYTTLNGDSTRVTGTISGTVSSDGMKLVSLSLLQHTVVSNHNRDVLHRELTVTDVPLDLATYQNHGILQCVLEGTQVQSHVGAWAVSWRWYDDQGNLTGPIGQSINWSDVNTVPKISVHFGH